MPAQKHLANVFSNSKITCCFFRHKNAPSSVYEKLEEAVEKIIVDEGATLFLVGNQGRFGSMALSVLQKMKIKYPHISYNVILVYIPREKDLWNLYEYGESMLPLGIESVNSRCAISWRNKWMVNEADVVIAYIAHSWGGAAGSSICTSSTRHPAENWRLTRSAILL